MYILPLGFRAPSLEPRNRNPNPFTVRTRLPHHAVFLNNHSTFPIFKYIMLFQMDVLLSAWTKLHIPRSLKSTERLNSQRPWSLASISPSREHERLGASLRRRVIAQSKAPTAQNCTGVSRRNVLGKD